MTQNSAAPIHDTQINDAQIHDATVRGFASDNYAGIHPDILAAIAASNGGHQISYGEDQYNERLAEVIAAHFGEGTGAYPVFNGTGANVVSLQSLLPRWGSVICTDTAHIHVDESNAPERVGGMKLRPVATPDGKLTPALIDEVAIRFGDEHYAQPAAVSITESTEVGTVYTPEEIRAIADHTHSLGMKLHLDGARLANAAASLGVPLRALTRDAGVDIVSFGGTKNGLMLGELILDFTGNTDLRYLVKANMQLGSKGRFIAAQFVALLENELWLKNARHANAMAARLAAGVRSIDGVTVTQEPQSNAVFAILPAQAANEVREQFRFYDWDESRGEVRWMCSFDTTEEDVDAFVAAIEAAMAER